MKKRIIALLVVVTLMLVGATAYAASDYQGFNIVNVKINGKTLALEVPAINFHGSTMLPLRKVAEALDAQVSWDAATQTANLVKPDINMIICDGVYYGDGKGEFKDPDGNAYQNNVIIYNSWNAQSFSKGIYDLAVMVSADDLNRKGLVEYRTVFEDSDGTALQSVPSSMDFGALTGGFYDTAFFTNIPLNSGNTYKVKFQIKDADGYKTVKTRSLTIK